jgi:ribosome-binding ATPase
MKAGLVGLPQSGKTTFFNALTALHRADAHMHLGAIKVPDPRVEKLAEIFQVRKAMHAEIVFVDVPGAAGGLSADAAKAVADVDALCLVLRGFTAADGAAATPIEDLRAFDRELVVADQAVVDRRLDRLRKAHGGRTGGEFHELSTIHDQLAAGRPLRTHAWTEAERDVLAPLGLLSLKPLLGVLNVAEDDAGRPVPAGVEAELRAHGGEALALCAPFEAEVAELDPAEQPAFLESIGLTEPVRERFIHSTYHLLDLITFFTLGQDEVRAWTLHKGDKAPRAAGRVNPELERGFSRIEVTHYRELESAGAKARSHLEGKEYVVFDGDLLKPRADH